MEIFTDDDNPNEYTSLPVGYLICKDCGGRYTDFDWPGYTWAGRDEREAFGWEDG